MQWYRWFEKIPIMIDAEKNIIPQSVAAGCRVRITTSMNIENMLWMT